MDDDDEVVDPGWVAGDFPDSLWFDLLNSVPLFLLPACIVGTCLPPLF